MRVLLGAMVLAVSFSCWAVESNPPAPTPLKQSNPPKSESKNDTSIAGQLEGTRDKTPVIVNVNASPTHERILNQPEEEMHGKTFPDWGGGETWVAIFTGALFVATVFLWRATRDLVIGAEKTAQRQLRAYLMIPHVISEDSIGPIEIKVVVPMQNFGQTPAHKCTFWADFTVDVYPLSTPLVKEPSADVGSVGVIPPTGTFSAHLSFPRFNEIKVAKNTTLYIFGRIEYLDVFDKSHWTEFRFYKQTPWNIGEWNIHPDGNDAT